MKKSNEILGLPVISITEGRELGMSKTLLIDAKNRRVAAITIEDEDWYRGVKLIPYDSVIAIGNDAVTVTSSETIIKLDEAADYENLLDENIRIIGTKAITKAGTIQGAVSEIYVGDDGTIERCEVTSSDGSTTEVTIDQISIFGKQVTVIDNGDLPEKKNSPIETPAPTPAPAPTPTPAPEVKPEPTLPQVEEKPEIKPEEVKPAEVKAEENKPAETKPEAAAPAVPQPEAKVEPQAEVKPAEVKPAVPQAPAKPAEVKPAVPQVEAKPAEVKPAVPQVEAKPAAPQADVKPAAPQAAAKPAVPQAQAPQSKPMDKAQEERQRRFLLGKKATRTIEIDNGIVIVAAGQEITEEILQKAKLANKFTELAMNVQ